jgi:hypothetical protein
LGTVLGHQLYLQPVTPTGHLVLIFQASSRNEANLGTIGSELKNCLIFARLSKMKLNLVPGFFLSSLMVCYSVSTCVIYNDCHLGYWSSTFCQGGKAFRASHDNPLSDDVFFHLSGGKCVATMATMFNL